MPQARSKTVIATSESASTLVTVGISEFVVSNDPNATLITHALGSCIAVLAYDAIRQYGGLLHYLLPLSKGSPEKAASRPAIFADTGIPALFKAMYELGSSKADITIKLAGGAKRFDDGGVFDIGKRNYAAARKVLRKNRVDIAAEDVGGTKPRTAQLRLSDGLVTIRSQGTTRDL